MSFLAQKFKAVPLFLQGVCCWICGSKDFQAGGVNFDALPFAQRFLDFTDDGYAGTRVNQFHQRTVVWNLRIHDDLDVLDATAVVDFKKREVLLRLTLGSNPAADIDRGAWLAGLQYVCNSSTRHSSNPWKDADRCWTVSSISA